MYYDTEGEKIMDKNYKEPTQFKFLKGFHWFGEELYQENFGSAFKLHFKVVFAIPLIFTTFTVIKFSHHKHKGTMPSGYMNEPDFYKDRLDSVKLNLMKKGIIPYK